MSPLNALARSLSFERWAPASFITLGRYSSRTFLADLTAGVTVGLVALPLAMAFAVSSGMPPQAGIYCAVVTGFLISAFGGSNVQIGGPTGAFVVVVSGIVATYGVDGLFMCTMMAGVILVVMGLTGTGTAVKFIPRPVVIGFTNGIALVIASTQIKDFLGITVDGPVPGEFVGRVETLATHIGTTSPETAAIGIGVVLLIIVWNRFVPRVPGYIVALVAGTAVVALANLPVETIGTRFGGIPAGLPDVRFPKFRPDLILTLLSPTLTVAMLGAIESLMSAVVADRMTGGRHNSNVELFAQGIANIVSPIVGGLPATGAIARTATNIRSGAKTPVAGMVHAITLLAVLALRGAAGSVDSARGARRHSPHRRQEHGGVARDSGIVEAGLDRSPGLDGDVRADRRGRSDRRCRSRDDSRGAALHPSRRDDDNGLSSHRRVRRRKPRAHAPGQRDSTTTYPFSAFMAPSSSGPRTSSRARSRRPESCRRLSSFGCAT